MRKFFDLALSKAGQPARTLSGIRPVESRAASPLREPEPSPEKNRMHFAFALWTDGQPEVLAPSKAVQRLILKKSSTELCAPSKAEVESED
jgi:hypothetical protein